MARPYVMKLPKVCSDLVLARRASIIESGKQVVGKGNNPTS
jgi:hypothetical protein